MNFLTGARCRDIQTWRPGREEPEYHKTKCQALWEDGEAEWQLAEWKSTSAMIHWGQCCAGAVPSAIWHADSLQLRVTAEVKAEERNYGTVKMRMCSTWLGPWASVHMAASDQSLLDDQLCRHSGQVRVPCLGEGSAVTIWTDWLGKSEWEVKTPSVTEF